MKRDRATLIGATAILMWSLLALFAVASEPVPPFLLNTLTFGIGGTLGLIWTLRRGFHVLRDVPLSAYLAGTAGLFGYHALYFTAFRLSPTAETGLVAYLWPLFIVLFSGLLPGERLSLRHVIGALTAFAGAGLVVLSAGESGFSVPALALAFCCAVTWAAYSVLSRRFGTIPTEAVTVYCLATALLSLGLHVAVEETVWPEGALAWLAILALGLGPVGAAFFTWDIGMKRGDIQMLGVASYSAPLLSTLALVAAGFAEPTWVIAVAAMLVAVGAGIAARKVR